MSDNSKRDTISESSIARIAGNIMSGFAGKDGAIRELADCVPMAVKLARDIAAEVERTRR